MRSVSSRLTARLLLLAQFHVAWRGCSRRPFKVDQHTGTGSGPAATRATGFRNPLQQKRNTETVCGDPLPVLPLQSWPLSVCYLPAVALGDLGDDPGVRCRPTVSYGCALT